LNLINIPLTPTSNSTILITPTSISVKWKWSNVFTFVLEGANKNNKIMVDVMECISVTHLEIEKCCNKIH
jgi:hypothetical protein